MQMPCVNKVMEPHDKQMKLAAFFPPERKLVNQLDLTEHKSQDGHQVQSGNFFLTAEIHISNNTLHESVSRTHVYITNVTDEEKHLVLLDGCFIGRSFNLTINESLS